MAPQGFISTYAPRLRTYANSLLGPAAPSVAAQNAPGSRTTKRGTTAINYAEDGYDDEDYDETDGPRRPTGLRSLRREAQSQEKVSPAERVGKELTAPVEVQGIWRDWMTRPRLGKTDRQLYAQTILPLTLIPIRIELDIPPFTPQAPFPIPHNPYEFGVNPALPAYKTPDMTPPYRLRDVFLWNLHETLITPDQFAMTLVNDLDLPNPIATAMQISSQIRTQLEEYAGVALHPLFHPMTTTQNGASRSNGATRQINGDARRSSSSNGNVMEMASATAEADPSHNPDDTYRCIITLNINLLNKLYTDKFEWSLLHPPGAAEHFARLTCADLGLAGEWIPAIAHAIYEAVLRLRKEACEAGGLVYSGSFNAGVDIDNLAAEGREAGWRFDNEQLGDEWGPNVELLSKEEIEKREGDRERQIRRLRRETARFSSSSGIASMMTMMGGGATAPSFVAGSGGGTPGPVGGDPFDATAADANNTTPGPAMGRGERSKKKRRFRSLSPVGRALSNAGSAGAGGRGTPDQFGSGSYGGGVGGLSDWERQTWRCSHCQVWGSNVWAVRDGPKGPRSLCNNCALIYEQRLHNQNSNLRETHYPYQGAPSHYFSQQNTHGGHQSNNTRRASATATATTMSALLPYELKDLHKKDPVLGR